MNPCRRFLALAASSVCVTASSSVANDLPPVPGKVLPAAEAPAAAGAPTRRHTSPVSGRAYTIRTEPEAFDSDAEEAAQAARGKPAPTKDALRALIRKASPARAAAAPKAVAAAPPSDIPAGEFYAGTDRAAAKLSVAGGPPEAFNDLADLIATLPPKDTMAAHDPPITRDADSGRVAEEDRNVRVRCWLYASSREADHDYHLILGRAPGLTPRTFMTMEVAGLPPTDADSFPQLFAARKSFNDFFGANLPGSGYDFFDPPIPVVMEGSLFFDVTHAQGTPPGPTRLRPEMPVIWEVHPVTRIEFEPNP